MNKSIEGIIVPVVTSFDEKEEINEGALHVILDFLIQMVCMVSSLWAARVNSLP